MARRSRSRANWRISGETPWAEKSRVAPVGDFGQFVDKNNAPIAEAVDDVLVMDDLVVDVDRRWQRAERQLQGFDGHIDARAESARTG